MPELDATLVSVLADRYTSNLARVCELAGPLTEEQFWTKPFPYGNSFGHIVLHLTGNLSYYIGAQIRRPDTYATATANLPSRTRPRKTKR